MSENDKCLLKRLEFFEEGSHVAYVSLECKSKNRVHDAMWEYYHMDDQSGSLSSLLETPVPPQGVLVAHFVRDDGKAECSYKTWYTFQLPEIKCALPPGGTFAQVPGDVQSKFDKLPEDVDMTLRNEEDKNWLSILALRRQTLDLSQRNMLTGCIYTHFVASISGFPPTWPGKGSPPWKEIKTPEPVRDPPKPGPDAKSKAPKPAPFVLAVHEAARVPSEIVSEVTAPLRTEGPRCYTYGGDSKKDPTFDLAKWKETVDHLWKQWEGSNSDCRFPKPEEPVDKEKLTSTDTDRHYFHFKRTGQLQQSLQLIKDDARSKDPFDKAGPWIMYELWHNMYHSARPRQVGAVVPLIPRLMILFSDLATVRMLDQSRRAADRNGKAVFVFEAKNWRVPLRGEGQCRVELMMPESKAPERTAEIKYSKVGGTITLDKPTVVRGKDTRAHERFVQIGKPSEHSIVFQLQGQADIRDDGTFECETVIVTASV